MAKSKSASPSDKARYGAYKAGGFERNRKRRLARHLKKHPKDSAAIQAAKNPGRYRRKKPKAQYLVPRDSLGARINASIAATGDGDCGPLLSHKEQILLNAEQKKLQRELNYDRLTLGIKVELSQEAKNIAQYAYEREHRQAQALKMDADTGVISFRPTKRFKDANGISRKKTKAAV